MVTTAPEQYHEAIDEVIVHLAAALAAQERADAIEGDAHMADIGRSLQKRWRGPDLERAVAVMMTEKKEVGR